MSDSNTTYVFSHSTLVKALKLWELEQIEAYPDGDGRKNIGLAVVGMQHFLKSAVVKEHKMFIGGDPSKEVLMDIERD